MTSPAENQTTGVWKAITGNRLRDGEVVFLASPAVDGVASWVERLDDAALLGTADAEAALAAASGWAARERYAVDIYAFDVRVSGDVRDPVKARERIRALGPTVRLDLGKQAAA